MQRTLRWIEAVHPEDADEDLHPDALDVTQRELHDALDRRERTTSESRHAGDPRQESARARRR